MTLREPYAQRDELMERVRLAAAGRAANKIESTVADHPEMIELRRIQQIEAQALSEAHAKERAHLTLELTRERLRAEEPTPAEGEEPAWRERCHYCGARWAGPATPLPRDRYGNKTCPPFALAACTATRSSG